MTFHFALGLGAHAEPLGHGRRRHHGLPLGPLAVSQAASISNLTWHLSLKALGARSGNFEMFEEAKENLGKGSRRGLGISVHIAETRSFSDWLRTTPPIQKSLSRFGSVQMCSSSPLP